MDRNAPERHLCSQDRQVDLQMWGLRQEIAAFEERFRTYVDSRHGQFDVWLAVRLLRGAPQARTESES
ncbi:hypothetical protein [Nocardioides sp. AN3]